MAEIYLPSPGAIPGIPGTYAPGSYDADYEGRTLTPLDPASEPAPPPDPSGTPPVSDPSAAPTTPAAPTP